MLITTVFCYPLIHYIYFIIIIWTPYLLKPCLSKAPRKLLQVITHLVKKQSAWVILSLPYPTNIPLLKQTNKFYIPQFQSAQFNTLYEVIKIADRVATYFTCSLLLKERISYTPMESLLRLPPIKILAGSLSPSLTQSTLLMYNGKCGGI